MTPPAQAGQMAAYGALPVPQMTPELISLIKTGTVYSLAVVWNEGIPVPTPMVPYTLSARLRFGVRATLSAGSIFAVLTALSFGGVFGVRR